jgi:hypothetical protein
LGLRRRICPSSKIARSRATANGAALSSVLALNLPGWAQSERFDQAWALIAATFRAEVTLLSDVVPIRMARL